MTLLTMSGCETLLGESVDPEVVERVAEEAIANQVFVEGGDFQLGDPGRPDGSLYITWNENSRPATRVELESYSISKYETTWGELHVYLKDTGRLDRYKEPPSQRKYTLSTDDPLSPNYHQKPARVPNYGEAEGYCSWLAGKTGLPFALPTEAQWEYAARSRGRNVPYATDTGEKNNDTYLQRPKQYIDPSIPPSGNMLSHASSVWERRPVGSYPPNPLGLHDMSGNVAEWTRDWFKKDIYRQLPTNNPRGPEQPLNPGKPEKTIRDWAGHGEHMAGGGTVFFRSSEPIDSGGNGFRCVVNSPQPIN